MRTRRLPGPSIMKHRRIQQKMIPAGSQEARDAERDYEIPTQGFCHDCEGVVDESAGKLHRSTCHVTPERKRAS